MEKKYLKRKPLKARRTPLKASKRPQKTRLVKKRPKRRIQVDLWREWLVPDGAYRRYKGLRGIYWYWLSRDVRRDEWEKYGVCITCLEPVEDWHYADCGHMVDAANCGEYLRFLRRNLALQHKKCNNPRFTPSAGGLNAVHYDQRYGVGAWESLFALKKKECKEPTQGEYRDKIRALRSFQEAEKLLTPTRTDSESLL